MKLPFSDRNKHFQKNRVLTVDEDISSDKRIVAEKLIFFIETIENVDTECFADNTDSYNNDTYTENLT